MSFQAAQLAEIGTATTHGGGDQIEIQLGHLCNNRCVFCVSGQMTALKMAKLIPLDPIRAALQDGASRGVTKVTFLGGEPTIQKSFLPALQAAKDLGYTDVTIFTNGVRLTQHAFVDEVLALGDYTWRISIQGGNEAAHVDVTKRPASFRRIVEGLRYLRSHDQDLTANLCLNSANADSLPDFVPLTAEHGIRQLHIDLMRPQDAGSRSTEELIGTMGVYGEMKGGIEAMLEGFDAADPDFDVNIGNLPFCVLPRWADRIHHGGQSTRTFSADGRGNIEEPWNKYEHQSSDKVHRDECDGCAFRGRCKGVFSLYVDAHGWDDFDPVPLDRLAEIDDRLGAFDLTVVPAIEPLQADPPGWTFRERRHDHRERRVDLAYSRGDEVLILEIHPPPSRRRSRLVHPALWTADLRVGISGTVDPAVLDWAADRLPGEVFRPVEAEPRVLARVVKLVQALKRSPAQSGWTLTNVQRLPDGAALTWSGPGRLEVRLRAPAGSTKPTLELPLMEAERADVEPLLRRLQTLARGNP